MILPQIAQGWRLACAYMLALARPYVTFSSEHGLEDLARQA